MTDGSSRSRCSQPRKAVAWKSSSSGGTGGARYPMSTHPSRGAARGIHGLAPGATFETARSDLINYTRYIKPIRWSGCALGDFGVPGREKCAPCGSSHFFCAFAFVFFDFNTGVLTLGGGLRGMIGNWRHTCWSQFGSKHKV